MLTPISDTDAPFLIYQIKKSMINYQKKKNEKLRLNVIYFDSI